MLFQYYHHGRLIRVPVLTIAVLLISIQAFAESASKIVTTEGDIRVAAAARRVQEARLARAIRLEDHLRQQKEESEAASLKLQLAEKQASDVRLLLQQRAQPVLGVGLAMEDEVYGNDDYDDGGGGDDQELGLLEEEEVLSAQPIPCASVSSPEGDPEDHACDECYHALIVSYDSYIPAITPTNNLNPEPPIPPSSRPPPPKKGKSNRGNQGINVDFIIKGSDADGTVVGTRLRGRVVAADEKASSNFYSFR